MVSRMLGHFLRVAHSIIRETLVKRGRSPEWPKVERLKRASVGACEVCGAIMRLQVHHIKPFHTFPELELDPSNLVVLCMGPNECHLQCGHGGSFRAYNPSIREIVMSAKTGKDLKLLQYESRYDRIKIT